MDTHWTCRCCGETFDSLPMSFGAAAPRRWLGLSEAERNERAMISSDTCIIDGAEFYVLGCVEIPVRDAPGPFVWLAWVSVSRASFERICDLWEAPQRAGEPPKFGWFETWFAGYPEPVEIKCNLHLRDDFRRPVIDLEPTDYPLAVEQREGITFDKVKAIASTAMRHRPPASAKLQ